jgi:hypothetical protein
MGLGHSPGTKYFDEIAFFYDSSNPRSFSGTGSTWFDISNSSTHSSISNLIHSGFGRTATTFVFNAISSVVNLGTNTRKNVTTVWTLDFWINPSGYGQNNLGRVYQHSGGSLTGFIVSVDNANNTAGLTLNTYAIAGFSAKCANVVALNTWQNFTLSFDSGVVTWYKNGASLGTSSITSPSSYTSDSYVGNSPAGTNTFAGHIGMIKLYRKALTAGDVLQNYHSYKGRYGLT